MNKNLTIIDKLLSNAHYGLLLFYAGMLALTYQDALTGLENTKLEIPALKRKIKTEKKKVSLTKEFLSKREESKSRIEDVAKDIEKVQRQLPNSISDTEILGILSSEAKAMNMKDLVLKPLTEENRGFYFAKRYEFKANGTFLQFLIFFERLSNHPRLINVTNLDVRQRQGRQKGRFQLLELSTTLEVFRYNPAHREDRGIQEIESQFTKGKGRRR